VANWEEFGLSWSLLLPPCEGLTEAHVAAVVGAGSNNEGGDGDEEEEEGDAVGGATVDKKEDWEAVLLGSAWPLLLVGAKLKSKLFGGL